MPPHRVSQAISGAATSVSLGNLGEQSAELYSALLVATSRSLGSLGERPAVPWLRYSAWTGATLPSPFRQACPDTWIGISRLLRRRKGAVRPWSRRMAAARPNEELLGLHLDVRFELSRRSLEIGLSSTEKALRRLVIIAASGI